MVHKGVGAAEAGFLHGFLAEHDRLLLALVGGGGEGGGIEVDDYGGPGVGRDAEFCERMRNVGGDAEIEHAGFDGAVAG